jgi:hypothetical protein
MDCEDWVPLEIGDIGFIGEASFTEGCLATLEDAALVGGINEGASGD